MSLKEMGMNEISIIGASGHAKVVIDLAEDLGYSIKTVFDQNILIENLLNHSVSHDMDSIPFNSIIAIGNNNIRKKIANEISLSVPALIHQSSFISKYSKIGNGTVVMSGVSINVDVSIGEHCIINTNSSIDHDCEIGNYVHISPNASLAGNVEVGECTHIGIGACIIQGIKIGKNCIVGAGSVIIRDVLDGSVIVGNPGKELKKIKKQ